MQEDAIAFSIMSTRYIFFWVFIDFNHISAVYKSSMYFKSFSRTTNL